MAGRRQIAALKLINTIRQHELDAIGDALFNAQLPPFWRKLAPDTLKLISC